MSIHTNIAAPDKLAQIVRPFVGTGRGVHRGNSAIDVLHVTNTVDASVRGVSAAGIDLLGHDGFAQFIPWADVRSITVRGIVDEETCGATVYENAAARWPLSPVGKAA